MYSSSSSSLSDSASDPDLPSQSSIFGSSPPPSIVSGRPAWPMKIMAKGRGRTLQYSSPATAGGSLVPGGLGTASYETLGGAGWGLAVRRLLQEFCRPVREAYAGEARDCRLAPGTTWVTRPAAFPVRASSAPRLLGPGTRGNGRGPVASRTPPRLDAPSLSLRRTQTSPDQIGHASTVDLETRQ